MNLGEGKAVRRMASRSKCRFARTPGALTLIALGMSASCVSEPAGERGRDYRLWLETDAGFQQVPTETRGASQATGPRPVESAGPRAQEDFGDIPAFPVAVDDTRLFQAEVIPEGFGAGQSPFHRLDGDVIRNSDGTFTKMYHFRVGAPGAAVYLELMKRFVAGFSGLQQGQDYWIQPRYTTDPRRKNDDVWRSNGDFGLPFGTGDVADLVLIKSTTEMLQNVDRFLEELMTGVPQVEIEVSILEVSVDDDLVTGIQADFTRGTEADPESGLLDNVVMNLAQDLVLGTFGSFSAIQDETVITGLIQFLQTHTYSNVLSAPKLAVLNGHRAVIDTGAETPFFAPKFRAAGIQTVTTSFKQTGIKVVLLPFIVSADTVQLEITIEASAITGFVESGVDSGTQVTNPLISRRNAHTIVNVPSGKTVLIGGLSTSDEIERIEKVPLLGDIPLLGHLFKRTDSSHRRNQVLFLVKPTILIDPLAGGVQYDPAEDE